MQSHGYKEVQSAFGDGSFSQADQDTLRRYISAIAKNATGDDAVQSRDIVQALTINHLSLQRHIEGMEARNKRTQIFVVVLALASLLGTAGQAWWAYKADIRSDAELKEKSTSALPSIPMTTPPKKAPV